MYTTIIFLVLAGADIGRPTPSDVYCVDARTRAPVGPGAWLDASEATAVVHFAETYESSCKDKVTSLAEHRDELQSTAVATASASSAAAGAASGAGLLAFLRRRKAKSDLLSNKPLL